jgi:hypothetical protein
MENENAKKDFVVALCRVQGTIEPAKKDSTNPHFHSKYASLEAVNSSVMGPLTENGFALLAGGVDIGGKPYLRTTLHHIAGHSESFDYPLISDTSNPQKVAAAVTYARRYSICALLNLSVEDADGNDAMPDAPKAPARLAADTPKPISQGNASGHEVHVFVPAVVTSKNGSGKKGPWTSYAVKLPTGDFASTFDEVQGKLLTDAKVGNKQVRLSIVKKGEYKNIANAELVPTTTDAEPEFEEVPY